MAVLDTQETIRQAVDYFTERLQEHGKNLQAANTYPLRSICLKAAVASLAISIFASYAYFKGSYFLSLKKISILWAATLGLFLQAFFFQPKYSPKSFWNTFCIAAQKGDFQTTFAMLETIQSKGAKEVLSQKLKPRYATELKRRVTFLQTKQQRKYGKGAASLNTSSFDSIDFRNVVAFSTILKLHTEASLYEETEKSAKLTLLKKSSSHWQTQSQNYLTLHAFLFATDWPRQEVLQQFPIVDSSPHSEQLVRMPSTVNEEVEDDA